MVMRYSAITLLPLLVSQAVLAHQPVMDMAPRWEDGFGIQTRVERFNKQTTNWLEGVYTFKPSKRVTFKLPYVRNSYVKRNGLNSDGFRNEGLGDLIIGVPLKKYANKGAFTSNWSITPSVQFPTGDDGVKGGGEWDVGLSLSYSSENPSFYQLYDLYVWKDKVGMDINVGLHPYHSNENNSGVFTMWDVSLLSSDNGNRIQSGPVLVYYWQSIMLRAEYKALVHESDSDIRRAGGDKYTSLGIGITF